MNKNPDPKNPVGRPPTTPDKELLTYSIRFTRAQLAKIELAGLVELRKLIDRWEVGGKH